MIFPGHNFEAENKPSALVGSNCCPKLTPTLRNGLIKKLCQDPTNSMEIARNLVCFYLANLYRMCEPSPVLSTQRSQGAMTLINFLHIVLQIKKHENRERL